LDQGILHPNRQPEAEADFFPDNIKRIVAHPGRPGQVAVRREEGRTHATGAMGRTYVV